MKKFRHKTTGEIGELREDGHLHFNISLNGLLEVQKIWKGFIENSQDWEEFVDGEYEVLSVIDEKNDIWKKRKEYQNSYFRQESNIFVNLSVFDDKYWKIHSVKRLSDDEVFTLGDLIDFKDFGNKGFRPIERFEIDYFDKTRITAYDGAYGTGLVNCKKKEQPLFTTEDGVEIFKGDKIYFVDETFVIGSGKAMDSDTRMDYKHFSTQELAEEYILTNKPLFNLKEVRKFVESPRINWNDIYKLAKNKISNS